jgi:hypothetical protein
MKLNGAFLLFCLLRLSIAGASQNPDASKTTPQPAFNITFAFGPGADLGHPNILDAAKGEFTKDMIIDPSRGNSIDRGRGRADPKEAGRYGFLE